MKYELVTQGERLAYLVSEKLLADSKWEKFGDFLSSTGRGKQFLEFYKEVAVIHLACRIVVVGSSLLKARDGQEASRSIADPVFVVEYRQYLREILCIPSSHFDEIYRQAERAVQAVSEDIAEGLKRRIKQKAQREGARCYICGVALRFGKSEAAPEGETLVDRDARVSRDATRYTCDHIWPQAYGGDSIEGNLLASCSQCNTSRKRNFASWAMVGVQSLIFGIEPSREELLSVEGSHKFAMHYYAVRRFAVEKRITLKDAFLRIGPWSGVRTKDASDAGDFFNLEAVDSADFFR